VRCAPVAASDPNFASVSRNASTSVTLRAVSVMSNACPPARPTVFAEVSHFAATASVICALRRRQASIAALPTISVPRLE